MHHEVDRRFLLGGLTGAAGVAALASLAKGGPLNPPAGAVNSTGRTLDEIYNKLPAVGGSDGRFPIPGGSTAFTITQPGSYVLTGNLATPSFNPISIQSDNVDLDLNGFVVTGSANLSCIVAGGYHNVRIRNGVVREGYYGIDVAGGLGWTVESVRLERCRWSSIRFNGGSGHTVRACAAIDTGAITLAGDTLNVNAIFATGSCNAICDTTVVNVVNNGSGGRIGIAVGSSVSLANSVSRCTVGANSAGVVTGIGISLAGAAGYRDCTVGNYSISYSGGTSLGGNL
jgi:hypothetical protein